VISSDWRIFSADPFFVSRIEQLAALQGRQGSSSAAPRDHQPLANVRRWTTARLRPHWLHGDVRKRPPVSAARVSPQCRQLIYVNKLSTRCR
jgi:hypothetical protein